jgi:hypothetical protein
MQLSPTQRRRKNGACSTAVSPRLPAPFSLLRPPVRLPLPSLVCPSASNRHEDGTEGRAQRTEGSGIKAEKRDPNGHSSRRGDTGKRRRKRKGQPDATRDTQTEDRNKRLAQRKRKLVASKSPNLLLFEGLAEADAPRREAAERTTLCTCLRCSLLWFL